MPAARPALESRKALDAKQLIGTLDGDSIAALHPDSISDNGDAALPAAKPRPDGGSEVNGQLLDAAASAPDSPMENYDELEIDPDALIVNKRKSMAASHGPDVDTGVSASAIDYEKVDLSESTSKLASGSQTRIQIKLEKTDRQGRYVLTADDPEIKYILRKSLEREEQQAGRAKKQRNRFRDLVFTRQFTTFDRQNPTSADSPFFGFFTLFWICMLLIFVQVAMRNWRDYGSFLGGNQVMKLMFSRDVVVLGVTDGVMCLATFEGVLFQKLVSKGYIDWAKTGWILQNLWQTAYLGGVIWWTYYRDWPWTHTIFAALHGLVFLMKQHSYAFYNGYLSSVYKRRALLERKLKQLEALEPLPPSPYSATSPRDYYSRLDSLSSGNEWKSHPALLNRRLSKGPATSTNLKTETSDVAEVAAAIESGRPIDDNQMSLFSSIIRAEIDDLSKDLHGKAGSGTKAYPKNLTIYNFAEYTCFPTLVYELEYPRQESINWWYVLEKTVATFGILCVMQVVSQGYIYPLVVKTMHMKESGMTLEKRWQEFPYIVSDMLFPLLIEQLLTWYLIWECILNVLAEVTCFADRGFYGDWWNSITWDQYARDWNRPVHNFLLRHVYHSSISSFHLSKTGATFVTFLLSALVHEMCMALIFKKVRGYLFSFQLLQLPLVSISRSKLMRGRTVLGNTIFWFGLFIGPSLLTSLYLVV